MFSAAGRKKKDEQKRYFFQRQQHPLDSFSNSAAAIINSHPVMNEEESHDQILTADAITATIKRTGLIYMTMDQPDNVETSEEEKNNLAKLSIHLKKLHR